MLASSAFAAVSSFRSADKLFHLHTTELGISTYDNANLPTLAVLEGNLIVCEGDGSNKLSAFNGTTGAFLGSVTLEGISCGSITNDAAGNLLIVNKAAAGEDVKIYSTNSINTMPELLISFKNDTDLPCGIKMTANGDIDGQAVIALPLEGVAGVTTSTRVQVVTINGGTATAAVQDLNGAVAGWSAGANMAGFATRSNDLADGFFSSAYGTTFCYVSAAGEVSGNFSNDTTGWGLNPNFMDSKLFNDHKYLALFVESHFPAWGMGPEFYLYDVTDMANFTGTAVNDLACLVYSDDDENYFQSGGTSTPWACVVLYPDEANKRLYAYALAHNSETLYGYLLSDPETEGVADIEFDENAPVEYFNLQGIRVANPENGIFIRRQGSNVAKVVL